MTIFFLVLLYAKQEEIHPQLFSSRVKSIFLPSYLFMYTNYMHDTYCFNIVTCICIRIMVFKKFFFIFFSAEVSDSQVTKFLTFVSKSEYKSKHIPWVVMSKLLNAEGLSKRNPKQWRLVNMKLKLPI